VLIKDYPNYIITLEYYETVDRLVMDTTHQSREVFHIICVMNLTCVFKVA